MFFFFFSFGIFISLNTYTGKTAGQISETGAFEETQTLLLTPKNLGMYYPTFLHENYNYTFQLSRRCRHLLEIT